MTEELKPCPFCGEVDAVMSHYGLGSDPKPKGRFIECANCEATGPSFEIQGEMPDRDEYTQSKAATAWNTRALELKIADQAAEIARLREANRFLRRGLYGLIDSGDADDIATALEAKP